MHIFPLNQKYLFEYVQMIKDLLNYDPGSDPNLDLSPSSYIFLLSDNDEIIGTGKIFIEKKLFDPIGHIEDIFIKKDFRSKGYGQKLLSHLSDFAKEKGCYKVLLNCKDSLSPFYEKCSFKDEGRQMTLRFK